MKKAIGYIRVSTDHQDLGPQVQQRAIAAWAHQRGIEVVAWFEDRGVSGGSSIEDRPGLLQALASLRSTGAHFLVAQKRDRVARDIGVALAVEKAVERLGGQLVTLDAGDGDDPATRLMRGILDLVAQYERDIIRARIKGALEVKKRKGERVGAIPYGWQLGSDGVHLVPEPDEQEVIDRVRELRAQGWGARRIANALTGEGKVTRTGKAWNPTQVQRIIARL